VQVGGTNVIYQSDAGSLLLVTAPLQYMGTLTAGRFFTFTGNGDVAVSGSILAASNNLAPIGLVKIGSGTLTLAGANTYTNGTSLNGGMLLVNGSLGIGHVNVTAGTLGGGSGILTAGDSFKIFSGTGYSGAFTTLSPVTPGPGLVWMTNNLTSSGTLAVALGNIQPQFGPVIVRGTNLVLNGTGGAAGYPYSVLTSTNLTTPLTNWNVIGTATFDRSGDFAFTNLLASQVPERVYAIQVR
jgi:autotransporter-associated beta strand protein